MKFSRLRRENSDPALRSFDDAALMATCQLPRPNSFSRLISYAGSLRATRSRVPKKIIEDFLSINIARLTRPRFFALAPNQAAQFLALLRNYEISRVFPRFAAIPVRFDSAECGNAEKLWDLKPLRKNGLIEDSERVPVSTMASRKIRGIALPTEKPSSAQI